MTLYVTRHAQPVSPDAYEGDQVQDRPLSGLGRRQADLLGDRLETEGFDGRVYVSPFHRCLETADRICRRTDTTFRPEPALAEAGGGWIDSFEGSTIEEIRASYDACESSLDALPDDWLPAASESSPEIEARVGDFVEGTVRAAPGDVLLVGHGATTGAVVAAVCGAAVDSEIEGSAGYALHYNATLTTIDLGPPPSLLLGNDTAHLPDGTVTSNSTPIR